MRRPNPLAACGARVHDAAREAVARSDLMVSRLENGPMTAAVPFDPASGTLVVDKASTQPVEACGTSPGSPRSALSRTSARTARASSPRARQTR